MEPFWYAWTWIVMMGTTMRNKWMKIEMAVAWCLLVSFTVVLACCSGGKEKPGEAPEAGSSRANSKHGAPPRLMPSEPSTVEPENEQGVTEVDGIVAGIKPQQDPPLYGRAFWNVVTIYEKPDMSSHHVGYLRAGGVVILGDEKVDDRTTSGPRCKKGWWSISDGGGYVCSMKGIEAARELVPSTLYPVTPDVEAVMPYAYGHVMNDFTPLYERIPKPAEEELVEAWIDQKKKELKLKELEAQQAEEAEKKAQAAAKLKEAMESQAHEHASAPAAPKNENEEEPAVAGAVNGVPEAIPVDPGLDLPAEQEPAADEEKDEDEPPFDFVRMLMLKGFYVSSDREMVDGGVKWLRTIKGQFVRADKILPVDIRIRGGTELPEGFQFPAGIVLRENIYERVWNDKKNHIMKNKDVLYDKFFVFRIFGTQVDKVKDIDTVFYEVDEAGEKLVLSWSIVPIMKAATRPPEVPEGGKWIHVDIGDQTLTAYEGERPVFLTLISSGNEEKDPEYATPRGTFQMQSKHVSATMDNLAMDDGAYSIEDVPWTMYFHSSYALHGAFWHSVFGHQRSHGCVNMTPKDAHWIFQWSDPALPLGWHGVVATKERPGTWVEITD